MRSDAALPEELRVPGHVFLLGQGFTLSPGSVTCNKHGTQTRLSSDLRSETPPKTTCKCQKRRTRYKLSHGAGTVEARPDGTGMKRRPAGKTAAGHGVWEPTGKRGRGKRGRGCWTSEMGRGEVGRSMHKPHASVLSGVTAVSVPGGQRGAVWEGRCGGRRRPARCAGSAESLLLQL